MPIIADPACGTGGFLLAAHAYIADPQRHKLDKNQKKQLRYEALRGVELVDGFAPLRGEPVPARHWPDDKRRKPPIHTDDSLRNEPSETVDVVITNPPFGKKSSITIVNDDGETDRETVTYNRPDFWTTTSNKQLNFVQHVKSLLKIHGRAAVVLPDNVLFEGGAGEKIRRKLLHECEVHTILRLPTGIFYAQGVKANVVVFDRRPGAKEPWTKRVWYYDLRTNMEFTLKERRISAPTSTSSSDATNLRTATSAENSGTRKELRGPLAGLQVRGACCPRQVQSRHLLAQRRVAGRRGPIARAAPPRGGDRRGPALGGRTNRERAG